MQARPTVKQSILFAIGIGIFATGCSSSTPPPATKTPEVTQHQEKLDDDTGAVKGEDITVVRDKTIIASAEPEAPVETPPKNESQGNPHIDASGEDPYENDEAPVGTSEAQVQTAKQIESPVASPGTVAKVMPASIDEALKQLGENDNAADYLVGKGAEAAEPLILKFVGTQTIDEDSRLLSTKLEKTIVKIGNDALPALQKIEKSLGQHVIDMMRNGARTGNFNRPAMQHLDNARRGITRMIREIKPSKQPKSEIEKRYEEMFD